MRYCFLILFCLAGCCGRDGYIRVQREHLDTQYLASCHVDSPDPRRCNFFGEQLIIQWKFPEFRKGVYLLLKVRGRNETIETVRIPVKRRRGSTIYRLTGRRYCEREGILTYQIDVMEGDCLLERWSHQVWADLIEIKDDE